MCSSEHPTPREHQPLSRSAVEAGSGSSGQELGSHAAENGLAPQQAGSEQAKAAEDHSPERGLSESPRQAQGAAAEQLDVTEDAAAAAAAVTCAVSGRHHSTDVESDGKHDEAPSAAAVLPNAQLDSCGGAASVSGPTVCPATASMKQACAASADCSQQTAESSAHSSAEVLPVSTRAFALPAADRRPPRCSAAAAPDVAESTCSAATSSGNLRKLEVVAPENASHDGRVEQPGAEDSSGSSIITNEPGAATPWSPCTAGALMYVFLASFMHNQCSTWHVCLHQ